VAKRVVAENGAAAPQGTADTQKGIVEAVSRVYHAEYPRNRSEGREPRELFSPGAGKLSIPTQPFLPDEDN
jgi:hypothetical protein